MKGFRFSLAAMLGFVAFAAIACRALFYPSSYWHALVQSAGVVLLFFAIFAAVLYRRRHARAFWMGVAIVGCGLLALGRSAMADASLTLITRRLTDAVHPQRYASGSGMSIIPANQQIRDSFAGTAFWLLLLVLATAGGLVARWISLREERLANQKGTQGIS